MTFFNRMGQTLVNFFGARTELDALAESKKISSDFLDPDYLADLSIIACTMKNTKSMRTKAA